MLIILAILYLIVGAAITFTYKYLTYSARKVGYYRYTYCECDVTTMAVLSGALWPVVAPFSFSILFARLYVDTKENKRGSEHD